MPTDVAVQSIEIENFLSIRSATVELGPLNVLIGANGAGKTNLIRAFEFLGRLAERQLAVFVGVNGGAQAHLNDRGARRIRLRINGAAMSYETVLVRGSDDDLVFEREFAGHDIPASTRWDTGSSNPTAGHRESLLAENGGAPGAPGAAFVSLLRGCRIFHFHDTSRNAPMKRAVTTADSLTRAMMRATLPRFCWTCETVAERKR